jgi:hypothetical protein
MRLIHLQSEILRYLLDPRAFQRESDSAEIPAALRGLDSERLGVLGLFSLGKRQSKIYSVLPKTWAYLRESSIYNFLDFASRYPQHDATYVANGKQYFEYLQEIWQRNAPDPAWLPDVARYEIEFAAARTAEAQLDESDLIGEPCRGCVRRHRHARLSRYEYDIRPILAAPKSRQVPAMRNIALAFLPEGGSQEVKVFELTPQIYDLLAELDAWSPIDRLKLDGIDDARELIRRLESLSLVEVCA